ncbi:extracellular triacylglycerol lipase precursor [Flagelloscypha sp. PMI_526]|nr:extracellular triacylglycerol lipase precursor [Flagelloscypha sp. PMI_526]
MRLPFALALQLLLSSPRINAVPEVQIGHTLVTGDISSLSTKVETFKGLPYAEPPTGERRFKVPVLKTAFDTSTFNASAFGFACIQQAGAIAPEQTSEDCLSLNVYRPVGTAINAKLSTLVFIHGGAWSFGGSSQYDGSLLVEKSVNRGSPVIVITINYRLIQLGFPQGEEAARKGALNLGLKDQLVALEWIQLNIAAFGGDKRKVTVAGESAGAYSVDTHLHGSKLKYLARSAIVESAYGQALYSPKDGNTWWADYVAAIPECASVANSTDTLSCLKTASVASLKSAVNAGKRFQPVLDGPGGLIPNFPSKLSYGSPLPLLVGSNKDEGTLFTLPEYVTSSDLIRSFILDNSSPPGPLGSNALTTGVDKILQLYPNYPAVGSPFGTGNETWGYPKEFKQYAAIFGDFFVTARTRGLAEEVSKTGQPTFYYYFIDLDAILPFAVPPSPTGAALGVAHSAELLYLGLFGPLWWFGIVSPTATALADQMQDYWISFITTGKPNDGKGTARPMWPLYTNIHHQAQLLQLDGKNLTAASAYYRKEQLDFLNKEALVWRR